jgi:hypothetical protein
MTTGFKDWFGGYVWEGSKTHTIRGGERWRAGMTAHCFVDSRRKGMTRLGNYPVIRVDEIVISETLTNYELEIEIAGCRLTRDEKDLFVWRDGFRVSPSRKYVSSNHECLVKFCEYWRAQAKKERKLPFSGQLIHWQWSKENTCPLPAKYGLLCPLCGKVTPWNRAFPARRVGVAIALCGDRKCGADLRPFAAELLTSVAAKSTGRR